MDDGRGMPLFASKGDRRIDSQGPNCGDERGHGGYGEHADRGHGQDAGIGWTHLVQHGFEHARHERCSADPDYETDCGKANPFADHQPGDGAAVGPERDTNADLPGPLGDRVGNQAVDTQRGNASRLMYLQFSG